ncbi:MAG: hypothetical protein GC179_28670 [Anaerolineaceae bacterium]|nr:hypothetical protein [Anaerolineaceae bacterium]
MTRKLIVLAVIILSTGFPAAAQDVKSPPPIIAQRQNKWYSVSAVDGEATLLVEPAAGETLAPLLDGNLSPDGQWLAYGTYKRDKALNNVNRYNLFLMNLVTREVEAINPRGGLFDRPVPPTHVFQLYYPTWSYDGTRLYFVRMEMETKGRSQYVAGQLIYFSPSDNTHHLVAQLNPEQIVDGVAAVANGVILRTVKSGTDELTLTLYAPNNSVVKANKLYNIYPMPVTYAGDTYYVEAFDQSISVLINAATGKGQQITETSFPAIRSQTAGDNSLRVFRTFVGSSLLRVYKADHLTLIRVLKDKLGVRLALSPDGQSLAYVLYDKPGKGMVRVVENDGTIRELAFEAELIVWGKSEWEAFAVLGDLALG